MHKWRSKLGWVTVFVALLFAAFAVLQLGFAMYPYADPPPPIGMIERAWSGAKWSAFIAAGLVVLAVFFIKSSRVRSITNL